MCAEIVDLGVVGGLSTSIPCECSNMSVPVRDTSILLL